MGSLTKKDQDAGLSNAALMAQGVCRDRSEHHCHAYKGISCKKCSVYKTGIKRREEYWKAFQKTTISSIHLENLSLGEEKEPYGEKMMVLRKKTDGGSKYIIGVYNILHILYEKDGNEQFPIVEAERQLYITEEEFSCLKKLLGTDKT